MRIKRLIIVSLLLAILAMGAVSASEDITDDDGLAVEDEIDDSIVEIDDSNEDEIIAADSNGDVLGSDTYNEYNVSCTVYDYPIVDDANSSYTILYCYVYANGYSNGEKVSFLVDVDGNLFSFERIMTSNNRDFYITNDMLGIHEFGDYKISVYFNSDKTGLVKLTSQHVYVSSYPFYLEPTNVYDGSRYPYGVKVHYQISLPANATGRLTLTVNGKTYDVKYMDGSGDVYVDTTGWNLGKYTAVARYEGNDEYFASYREATIEIQPKIMIPTEMATGTVSNIAVGENETVTIIAPSDVGGEVVILVRDKWEVPIARGDLELSNGTASYSFAYLPEGQYYVEMTGYVGNYTVDKTFTLSIINVSDEYSSSISSSEIFEGDNVYMMVSKPFEAIIMICIDEVPLKMYAYNTEFCDIISGLGVGIHKIKIIGQVDSDFYSNTFMITVKNRPAPTPSPDPAPAPAKDTIKLTLKKVKVKKSAKKLVLQSTLKINGKAKKGLVVKFKFNKKTYKAKTDERGIAKVTIKKTVLKKLKEGKKLTYQVTYGKTVKKITVKVLK